MLDNARSIIERQANIRYYQSSDAESDDSNKTPMGIALQTYRFAYRTQRSFCGRCD